MIGSCTRALRTQQRVSAHGGRALACRSRAANSSGVSSAPFVGGAPRVRGKEKLAEPPTSGGTGGPPKQPPRPPRSTAEGAWDADGDSAPKEGWLAGWHDRVAADPQFVYKVLIEQIIGVGAAVLGDMSTRPNWGLNELDFVFSTLVVGSLMNFALMYLLAPTRAGATAAAPRNLIAKLFDERTLTKMGAPGGHIFEAGYSLKGRVTNLAFKACMFGVIGFAAGLAGTLLSNGLIKVRQQLDSSFELQNETPNVLLNSAAWTMHMGISSNVRYQALYGLDILLVSKLPVGAFRLVSAVVRTLNNVIGGMSFVTCARIIGSQKAAPAPLAATPPLVPLVEEMQPAKKGWFA